MANARKAIFTAEKKGRMLPTLALAKRWLDEHPGDRRVRFTYALALRRVGRCDEAIAELQRIVPRSKRSRADHLVEIGHVYEDKGDLDQAESWYRQAIEADPNGAHPWVCVGSVQGRRQRFAEAEASYRTATTKPRDAALAWVYLGMTLVAQGRLAEAAAAYREALVLEPKSRRAKFLLRDVVRTMALHEQFEAADSIGAPQPENP